MSSLTRRKTARIVQARLDRETHDMMIDLEQHWGEAPSSVLRMAIRAAHRAVLAGGTPGYPGDGAIAVLNDEGVDAHHRRMQELRAERERALAGRR